MKPSNSKCGVSTWFVAVLVQLLLLTNHHSPFTLSVRAEDGVLDSLMHHDPELQRAEIVHLFPPNPLPVWLVALQRPETDYQYRAALTIILAHQADYKGMEAAIDPLLEALVRPNQKEVVRLAVARALIELDARQSAFQLFQQAKEGNQDFRNLIEPALAQWNFRPAGKTWLERLGRPDAIDGDLVLALRGLAALKENEAIPRLTELIHSQDASWPLRLEAARALGEIKTSGSEAASRQLSADTTPAGMSARLAAASLLRHHQGEEAVKILQNLQRDSEPAVAAAALERIMELDPKLVIPSIDVILANPDAKVRSFGVEALYRIPTAERIPLLAARLDDRHPDVRTKARKSLHDLGAKPVFHDTVIGEGMKLLNGSSWRELEQATILLTQLDHKPAAERLVELLKFERPEVFISAAWGIRRLAVPETLPKVLDHFISTIRMVQTILKEPKISALPGDYDQQLSHLAQFMGRSKYQPAVAVFLPQIPRFRSPKEVSPVIGFESRAASVWALGWIYEDKPEPTLVTQLEERMNDGPKGMDPGEVHIVRTMCAISLGRMKSMKSLPSLRRWNRNHASLETLPFACGWAIHHLTGEALPTPGTINFAAGAFRNFLQNFSEPKSSK
jgi:HEAT repeat protein